MDVYLTSTWFKSHISDMLGAEVRCIHRGVDCPLIIVYTMRCLDLFIGLLENMKTILSVTSNGSKTMFLMKKICGRKFCDTVGTYNGLFIALLHLSELNLHELII